MRSRAHNKRLIADGKVVVERASVSRLPFTDDFFELVTAVETQYDWPDVVNDMREIPAPPRLTSSRIVN
jgi:hypothetical protein